MGPNFFRLYAYHLPYQAQSWAYYTAFDTFVLHNELPGIMAGY